MRVVFVTTVFEDVSTGPGIYARYLWQAFRDDTSIEFHVVAPTVAEKHPRLHAVGLGNGSSALYRKIQQKAHELTAGREAETIVHGNASHSMWQFVSYPGQWLAQVNDYLAATVSCRPFHVLSTSGIRRFVSLAWRHRRESEVIRSATRLVCNSLYTRSKILECYKVPEPKRLVTIYKAVDQSIFLRPGILPADPFPDRPKGARLVFAGTDWRTKGLDDLILAISCIAKRVPKVHLTVAGRCGPGSPRHFTQLMIRSGVSDRVTFVGSLSRNQLAATFFHSDIFVLPSRDEAFGVAILEALSAGLPVVSTKTGGIPEVISDNCGLLCRPGDPNDLAESLTELLTNQPRREAFALAGPLRASKFSVESMTDAVRNLYRTLAGE